MKKMFLSIVMLVSLSFCFMERPTGQQMGDARSAVFFSASTNADELGKEVMGSLGFDFSVSDNVELSLNMYRTLGDDLNETTQSFQIGWWLSSAISISYATEFGHDADDANLVGAKFLRGNSWLSYTADPDDTDNAACAIGKVWNREGKLSLSVSYHFSTDNFDKGNLQLGFGTAI